MKRAHTRLNRNPQRRYPFRRPSPFLRRVAKQKRCSPDEMWLPHYDYWNSDWTIGRKFGTRWISVGAMYHSLQGKGNWKGWSNVKVNWMFDIWKLSNNEEELCFRNVKLIDNKNRKVINKKRIVESWIKRICLPRVDLSFFVYFLRLTNQKVNLSDAGICNIDKLVTSFCLRAFNLLTRDRFCDLYKPLSLSSLYFSRSSPV